MLGYFSFSRPCQLSQAGRIFLPCRLGFCTLFPRCASSGPVRGRGLKRFLLRLPAILFLLKEVCSGVLVLFSRPHGSHACGLGFPAWLVGFLSLFLQRLLNCCVFCLYKPPKFECFLLLRSQSLSHPVSHPSDPHVCSLLHLALFRFRASVSGGFCYP